MDNAKFYNAIEVPPGSRQGQTISISPDATTVTETFKIKATDLLFPAIPYIVGTSTVNGAGINGSTLARTVPARHPVYKGMRATKITNIVGVGGPLNRTAGTFTQSETTAVVAGNTVTTPAAGYFGGDWKVYYVTVQFEQPNYPMLPDANVGNTQFSLPGVLPGIDRLNLQSEYVRWCVRNFKPQIETLARKSTQWQLWLNGNQRTVNPQGDIYLRAPMGILEMKWYDVPEQWTHLGVNGMGGILPTNIMRAVGSLNSRFFPFNAGNVDQVVPANGEVTFAAGTLLFLEPEAPVVHSRFDPQLYSKGFVNPELFPRSYDWTFRWLYFDPEINPGTFILANPRYDPTQVIVIRGHNCLPTVGPVNGYNFYPAVNAAIAQGNYPPRSVIPDYVLLYPYFNHELIFHQCQPLSRNGIARGGLWPWGNVPPIPPVIP